MKILHLASAYFAFASGLAQAQINVSEVVKLGDVPDLVKGEKFQKYITRGNNLSLVMQDMVFSESFPGKFMLDLKINFNSGANTTNTLRILFDDLIPANSPGESVKLKKSGEWIARDLSLSEISDVVIQARLVPIVDGKYDQAYGLLAPILSKPIYGLPATLDLGSVVDKFSSIATAGDNRNTLLFNATIPVPQNVVEAQTLEKKVLIPPLRNNEIFAIEVEGEKYVSDAALVGKAKDFINGVATFVSGKSIIERPKSSFKGMIALRFTKDTTQPLPTSLISQLKELSDSSENASTDLDIQQMALRCGDALKTIEAISKSKSIDSKAEFHLRNYVEMSKIWANYKKSINEGPAALKISSWRANFKTWFSRNNILGSAYYTQAYGVSEIYSSGKVAKIFVPYSLSDEMTLEILQRQMMLHSSLSELSDIAI